jgi:hypothetical protein
MMYECGNCNALFADRPKGCTLDNCPYRLSDYLKQVDAARAAGIAVEELSPRQVSQAQRRLSRLYSEPAEGLWGILDVAGKVLVVGGNHEDPSDSRSPRY